LNLYKVRKIPIFTMKTFLLWSPRALIQLARAKRDRLIFDPSNNLCPVLPVKLP